jgi:drug/metabolite transporter (DMT)-like permease
MRLLEDLRYDRGHRQGDRIPEKALRVPDSTSEQAHMQGTEPRALGGDYEPGAPRVLMARFAVLLVVLIWGGQYVVARADIIEGRGIDAAATVALRFAVAALFFGPLALRWGLRDLCGLGWQRGSTVVLLAGAPYTLIVLGSLHVTSIARAATINPATVCLFAVLIPWIVGREGFPANRLAGVAVVATGLILLTGVLYGGANQASLIGDGLLIVSGALWALYIFLIRRWRLDPWRTSAVIAVLSGLYALPYLAIAGLPGSTIAHVEWTSFYQGLLVFVVANSCFTWAIGILGAREPDTLSAVVPAVGTLLGFVVLGEQPSAIQFGGIVLIVGGARA